VQNVSQLMLRQPGLLAELDKTGSKDRHKNTSILKIIAYLPLTVNICPYYRQKKKLKLKINQKVVYNAPKRDYNKLTSPDWGQTHERSREMRVKLQMLRKEAGYTQQSFGDKIGISRNHYGQIETGEKNPSLETALKIKAALGYKDDDIFFNEKCPILRHNTASTP
jgi:putative transcriptional regulator